MSKDFNHKSHSSIIDATQTQVIQGKFSRVLSWYDNEYAYSTKLVELMAEIHNKS